MNWLSIAMISVAGSLEIHAFASAEVHKFWVEVAEPTDNIMCSGMAIQLGNLKGKLTVEPVWWSKNIFGVDSIREKRYKRCFWLPYVDSRKLIKSFLIFNL